MPRSRGWKRKQDKVEEQREIGNVRLVGNWFRTDSGRINLPNQPLGGEGGLFQQEIWLVEQDNRDAVLGMRLSDNNLEIQTPITIKEQIKIGQYVNLAMLLKGPVEMSDFTPGGSITMSKDGTLQAKPRECKDKVPNIEKWTDAFIIFLSVYKVAVQVQNCSRSCPDR